MRSLVVVILAVVFLTGCAGIADGSNLDGSNWQLTRWAESGSQPQAFRITASFAEEKITGKSGVNNYFGSFTTGPKDKCTVGPAGSTMMAGPPEAMQAEQTYLQLLGEVRTCRRTGAELVLSDADGKALLTFTAAP